ncbi:MAG: L,D-transpeptidase family protein [Methyloceanibacter sp.]
MSLALAVGRSVAGPNDPLNPFSAFTDSGPMTQEEKERRQQQRDSLYDRLSPDYRMSVPFVSEAAVSGLQLAIERYSRIVAAGGWPSLSGKVTLRYGDSGTEITAISTRLVMEGDLPPGAEAKSTFDDEFRDGLVRFQIRNGLRVTGFVDTRTLRELNVPATERQQQLQMNLPRLQELMKINKEARYVLVNVPSYTAQAVQGGQLALDSAVVVGKPQRATPQLTAKVVEVNFYPTWSVPESVAAKDLIPTIRKNPNYFYEQRFNVMRGWNGPVLDASQVDWASPEVVSYKFRQDPGPQNALGLVRINMPNKHAVYMHDTPLKALFSSQTRAFSSGCVRVERVLELVAWLLSDQGWSLPKVQAEIESGKQLNVKLKRAVPVHFVYLTAYASPNGLAQFRPDIYGRDASFGTLDEQEDAIIVQESRAVTP